MTKTDRSLLEAPPASSLRLAALERLAQIGKNITSKKFQFTPDHRRCTRGTAGSLFTCEVFFQFLGKKTSHVIETLPIIRIHCPRLQEWWRSEVGGTVNSGIIYRSSLGFRAASSAPRTWNLFSEELPNPVIEIARLIDNEAAHLFDRTENPKTLLRELAASGGIWEGPGSPAQLPLDLFLFLGERELAEKAFRRWVRNLETSGTSPTEIYGTFGERRRVLFSTADAPMITTLKLAYRYGFKMD